MFKWGCIYFPESQRSQLGFEVNPEFWPLNWIYDKSICEVFCQVGNGALKRVGIFSFKHSPLLDNTKNSPSGFFSILACSVFRLYNGLKIHVFSHMNSHKWFSSEYIPGINGVSCPIMHSCQFQVTDAPAVTIATSMLLLHKPELNACAEV